MQPAIDLVPVAQAICGQQGLHFVAKAGEGAFKQTFRVETSDGTAQALKVYKAGYHSERSEREIRAMQTCDHSNIARLTTIDHIDVTGQEHLYTLEEFLGGSTLTERLQRDGLFDAPAVIALGTELIDAVGHIATHQFVHRDLKPDNILFREGTTTPVIVDFGLVRDLSATSLTVDWAMPGPGTPIFAAPEQLNNAKHLIDWRTDQFSLGVVLAICIFGQHPYDRGDIGTTIQTVATHGQVSAAFTRNVRQSGLGALAKMVAPWPATRFRTTQELATTWALQGTP